ncbi:MAG TPA: hypothetical protein PKE69_27835 [Pyrinomonadaceae bacterium]|nr:hypothetical protein [Pyrinomonadaceae bacterium]
MKNILFIFLLLLISCVETAPHENGAANVIVYGPVSPDVEYYSLKTNFDFFPYRINRNETLSLSLDFDTKLTCSAHGENGVLIGECSYFYVNKNNLLFKEYQKSKRGILSIEFFDDSLRCIH